MYNLNVEVAEVYGRGTDLRFDRFNHTECSIMAEQSLSVKAF